MFKSVSFNRVNINTLLNKSGIKTLLLQLIQTYNVINVFNQPVILQQNFTTSSYKSYILII